jgi:nucleoside-diphosphate-sugar epimerase
LILIFGLAYCGRAIAQAAAQAGCRVAATVRVADPTPPEADVEIVPFEAAGSAITSATGIVITVPPDEAGDPVLLRHTEALSAAPALRWIGYLSSTGVYGDLDGGSVDEDTEPDPQSPRARRRMRAEQAWSGFAGRCAVDIFRLAGIYGPGRSALDDLRRGRAKRVIKPGHLFSRIHRDDIATGVLAASRSTASPGRRVFNFADDYPAASADVVAEAAALLGLEAPPLLPYDEALPEMSPLTASFWRENRRIGTEKTKAVLGMGWKYPSYREGLRAILAEQAAEPGNQQGDILRTG